MPPKPDYFCRCSGSALATTSSADSCFISVIKTELNNYAMASNSSAPRPIVTTTFDSSHSLIAFNILTQAPFKLNPTNYLAWCLQFFSLLIGYDILGFIDGTKSCPPATILQSDSTSTEPNLEFSLWIQQDKLLLNAIISSMSSTLVHFIASFKSTMSKGLHTITEYM